MSYEEVQKSVRKGIEEYFKLQLGRPEILNRIGENIVVFDFIREDVANDILKAQVNKIIRNLQSEKKITLSLSDAAMEVLRVKAVGNLDNGGRGIGNIKRIYLYEDAPIDWAELIAGATADDLLMDQTVHAYCAQMAPRILSGDVDAYLEVIERMRPVDDLALYSGDFEFGTDSPSYIEVEFNADPDRVLADGYADALCEEFVSAVSVRVARDLFALLPVAKVLVHVEINGNTVLSVIFVRNQLCAVNFRN